ncbi:MAG: HEAT repeat domain-containing protein [Pleurocapsa minor GSE-CHR-MK-17-07R]|jgi:HEAT repeat protein|nr:HEAT repeat domain-containing protein [Pleurocapsa minor GSE-CHR-MK 17-07R]
MWNETISQWVDLLNHEDSDVRNRAKGALREYGPLTIHTLVAVMRAGLGRMAWEAASLLQGMDDERVLAPMAEMLRGRHPIIGPIAAQTLARHGSRYIQHLLDSLPGAVITTQIAIIQALATIGDRRALPPLVELMQITPSPSVRYTIITALAEFDEPALYADIGAYAYDSDHHVRDRARRALRRIDPARYREDCLSAACLPV